MFKIKPLGTVQLSTANGGGIPLEVNLETGPAAGTTQAAVTTAAAATTAGQPSYAAISIVGKVDNHAIDLGVRREGITAENLPADFDLLFRTDLVAQLVAEYGERLADLTVQLAGLGLATPDSVPVAFTVEELEYLRHCLTLVERRWREAIDNADTVAQHPQRDDPPSPGHINVKPTPAGYRTAARMFGAELERLEQFGHRLARLLDLAHAAGGEDGDPA